MDEKSIRWQHAVANAADVGEANLRCLGLTGPNQLGTTPPDSLRQQIERFVAANRKAVICALH